MQRYTNFIASTTATNSTLTVLSNASCVVYIAGTLGAATLYSDNGVTPLANPFVSSATGRIDFYAANGRYDVVVSKVGFLSVTISDIELDDLLAPSGSNSVGYLPAGAGAVATTVQTKLRAVVSVKDFGATGDGVTDDSAAFQLALNYANAVAFAAVGTSYPMGTARVTIPAGKYIINTGLTATNLNCQIVGDGREVVEIKLGAGIYFLTVSASIYQTLLKGISFNAGAGALINTTTAVNVLGLKEIQSCNFNDYTVCAIGSLSADSPYWEIQNCLFYGTTASKGIVLSGDNSGSLIQNNSFLLNRYHIKLFNGGLKVNITDCDFIRFVAGGGAPVLTDIWLVPKATITNAGNGFLCSANSFGNENLNALDYRVLYADEAAGTDAFDKNHATTLSTGFVVSNRIINNYVSAGASHGKGFVYSYTPNVYTLELDNQYILNYPYLLEFDALVTVSNDRLVDSSTFITNKVRSFSEIGFGAASNAKLAKSVNDPWDLLYGSTDYQQTQTSGYDSSLVDLWTTATSGVNAFTLTNATRVAGTDSAADADAAEITFTTSAGLCYGYMATPTNGRLTFAEIEIKSGATQSVTKVTVRVREDTGGIVAKRVLSLIPNVWQRIKIPFVVRTYASPLSLQVVADTTDFSAGVRDRIQIGRARVYHAAEPVEYFARRLSAKATYNAPNILNAASTSTTVTVTGAALGDFAIASLSISLAGLTIAASVSAVDTVTVVLSNLTGGAVDLASATLRVQVIKMVNYA